MTFLFGASITAGLVVFHVAFVPLLFKYSKAFQRNLIFANFVQWPLNIDYEDPSQSGIQGGRNISIEYNSRVDNCRVKIGVWHILPKSSYEKLKGSFGGNVDKDDLSRQLDEELANSKLPVMFYCHGNSNSRAASHRIELYKFFQQMDFHTIAFDYRGYGDSTNIVPSERGVVEDSVVVYDWLNNTIRAAQKRPAVFVWGHSLGTGISSHMLGNLQELSQAVETKPLPQANGLILEAPFNNLADEVAHHPLAKLVSWLPYFESTFVSPFVRNDKYSFNSDEHLSKVDNLPVLILHAKDDVIVPFVVGVKLFRAVLKSRNNDESKIKLHAFDKSERLGHKFICHAKQLPTVVGEFVSRHR
ncbi:lysophosphatidylserine lipase ABHD12-like isoform X2 [Leptidea sinapis]|uniref:lysophosphatidylserine lipase ABHD12-like isoform X2 n=1 Tax=Leptidea sinapis TaxID=189913 RepID=UPI0021C3A231|nr:lysophosphatidylserine lipase ABHD12-like isoform X2 [Leptidea sinapis]